MAARAGDGWHGVVEGRAPVQGFGRVDGHAWYFRARWAAWSMEIAQDRAMDPDAFPTVGADCSGWLMEEDWGTESEASFMNEDAAWALITRCIEHFRSGQMPYVEVRP